MPYPASYIAHALVQKGIESGQFVTQMKLQKMVFFAHGYHLAKYNGEPLIQENFEAWRFGPVVPDIYQDFKLYGSSPIRDTDLCFTILNVNVLHELDDKAKDAIDYTWEATKDIGALALSNWTHSKDSPWSRVYQPGALSVPIDNNDIKEYFENLLAA